MLMGGGPAWAAWAYGICAGLVAVALTARIRLQDPRPPNESSMRELTPAHPALGSSPPPYENVRADPYPAEHAEPSASLPSSPPWAPARRPTDPNEP
jgi:hypothetical protein